jgi:hypothetical protein
MQNMAYKIASQDNNNYKAYPLGFFMENPLSGLFREFIYQPTKEELEAYRKYYDAVCEKRIFFYNEIGNENKKELADCACNFLYALNIFEDKVPKRIIRERFEDFKQAGDLAREIIRDCLHKSRDN